MKYQIKAMDARGKTQVLEEDFPDEKTLRKEIKKRGLTLLEIKNSIEAMSGFTRIPFLRTFFLSKSLSLKEKEQFVGEVLLLLDSGVKLQNALSVMGRSLKKPRDKQLVEEILAGLQEGKSFPDALESKNILSATELGVLRSGEEGGEFKEMLRLVHQNIRQRLALERQLLSLIAYPSLLILMAAGVFTFLSFRVLPELTKLYDELRLPLPAGTAFVIGIITFIRKGGWIATPFLFALVWYLIGRIRRNPAPFQKWFFRVPLLGEFLRRYLVLGFLPSLTLYLRKKIPPREALENLKTHFSKSPLLLSILDGVLENLKKGETLTKAFQESALFSLREKELLEIGESSSKVVETLDRIHESTKTEQEEQIKRTVTLLEPAVIVSIGGLVLFFVVVFVLPLIQMDLAF